MEIVRQPPKSNQCGQACIAMLAGVTLERAVEVVGTSGKTRTRDIVPALATFGFFTEPKRTTHRSREWNDLPSALLILHVTNGHSRHWIIYDGRKFYDPAAGVFRKPPKYLVEKGGRPTSYLTVMRDAA